jgi:hypothetical protein
VHEIARVPERRAGDDGIRGARALEIHRAQRQRERAVLHDVGAEHQLRGAQRLGHADRRGARQRHQREVQSRLRAQAVVAHHGGQAQPRPRARQQLRHHLADRLGSTPGVSFSGGVTTTPSP